LDVQDSTAATGAVDSPKVALERHDEPPPRPAASDLLEAITGALEVAVDPAEPQCTTTRAYSVLVRLRSGLHLAHDDGGEATIRELERLVRSWPAEDGKRS
jgi:hypothetical protein